MVDISEIKWKCVGMVFEKNKDLPDLRFMTLGIF